MDGSPSEVSDNRLLPPDSLSGLPSTLGKIHRQEIKHTAQRPVIW